MKAKITVDKYGITGCSGIGVMPGFFHVSMPYSALKGVFVDAGEEGWERMSVSKAKKLKRRIITCYFCNQPAKRVDHHYPYMIEMNACEKHLNRYAKECDKAYEEAQEASKKEKAQPRR